jgi:hypothetical protein
VYVGNTLVKKQVIAAPPATTERHWEPLSIDLSSQQGQTVQLRLYQRVLLAGHTAGNAYWKALIVK